MLVPGFVTEDSHPGLPPLMDFDDFDDRDWDRFLDPMGIGARLEVLERRRIRNRRIYSPKHLPRLIPELGIQVLILAMPSLPARQRREILASLEGVEIKVKVLPSVNQLLDGKVTVSQLRDVHAGDLLWRQRHDPDDNLIVADIEAKSVMVGFARNAVMGVAGTVIEAVKNKAIRHFFLVAGCDGAKPGRNYYTEFVEKVPEDCVVLTLACGKFRFFDQELGDIGGIPRLLDVGQCNDAYSAIQIAVALANAFECGVNDLPLSMIISWYEQKACAILLTLLHLGIKDIRLGPSLPAFVSPNILNVLVENFNIMPINSPDEDLKAILG